MSPKIRRLIKKHLTPKGNTTAQISDFKITYNRRDNGGIYYESRSAVEERNSPFYSNLRSEFNPEMIIDVGANYGFTGCIFGKTFPTAKLVLIEADPALCPFVEANLEQNGITQYELVQAVCGNQANELIQFGINPHHSQDNRVRGLEGWQSIEVRTVTLTELLKEAKDLRVLIKIDTQGFETQVLSGASEFLLQSKSWFVKTEFGPDWLESQDNSPEDLLRSLIDKYLVAEAPARTRFGRDQFRDLFLRPLENQEVSQFVNYVRSLNKSGLGWVDLYVIPKGSQIFPNSSC